MSAPGESGPSIAADPDDLETCPHCGAISGVRVITGAPPKVQAWSCAACGTDWAFTTVNLHVRPFLEQLAART